MIPVGSGTTNTWPGVCPRQAKASASTGPSEGTPPAVVSVEEPVWLHLKSFVWMEGIGSLASEPKRACGKGKPKTEMREFMTIH